MTRRKIKHEQLSNTNKRNTILRNRRDGLLKKANDLSILCGVDIGIVIHTQEENNAVEWPSPETFNQRLHKFFDFPDAERNRKMVIHDNYLEQYVADERKKIIKSQETSELNEFHILMEELTKGKNVDELNLYQLNILHQHSAEFLKKLQKSDDELNNDQMSTLPHFLTPALDTEPSTTACNDKMIIERVLDNMKRDACFSETMFEGRLGGFMIGSPPPTGTATNINDLNTPSPPTENNNAS